ncbi:MAG: phosphatase PAP2 family protein [Paludibacter sp.]|nr:phosphatase PAP2 family protein [Paludibacter sp.]
MNFLDTLNHWDTSLFLLINGLHTSFFDGFMWAISAKLTWIPLYLSVLFVVIKIWKKDAVWIILSLILCVVLADQISSGIIKNLVQRLRPSHTIALEGVIHLVRGSRCGLYGFVSSHAANAFGFALLTSLLLKCRPYTLAIFFWAVMTAYSRIYLGVHYPFDVLGGAVVGVVVALFCFWTLNKFLRTTHLTPKHYLKEQILEMKIPTTIIAISFGAIILYSLVIF